MEKEDTDTDAMQREISEWLSSLVNKTTEEMTEADWTKALEIAWAFDD